MVNYNVIQTVGVLGVFGLATYGAVSLGKDIYEHFKEPGPLEEYRISLMYCNPMRCVDNTVPGLITVTRIGDSRSLWSASIKTMPNSHRPYVGNTWIDPELTETLDGGC